MRVSSGQRRKQLSRLARGSPALNWPDLPDSFLHSLQSLHFYTFYIFYTFYASTLDLPDSFLHSLHSLQSLLSTLQFLQSLLSAVSTLNNLYTFYTFYTSLLNLPDSFLVESFYTLYSASIQSSPLSLSYFFFKHHFMCMHVLMTYKRRGVLAR